MRPSVFGFEYARISVPDMAATGAFYQRHVGLDVPEPPGDHLYLRAELEHHCLDIVQGPAGRPAQVTALGYSVLDTDSLSALAEQVEKAGGDLLPVDDAQRRYCEDGFAVRDPNGMVVEVVANPYVFAAPPRIDFRPLMIVHPFLSTDRYKETVAFYSEALGFRASDYIEDNTAFMRSDNLLHHSLAILEQDRFNVDHLCFMVRSLDDLMYGRALALHDGVRVSIDLVKHSASESMSFYMIDPDHGPQIELALGHRLIEPEADATHRPRRMLADPRNIMDIWRAGSDDWREGEMRG
jgi:catechol 2,3-dioxygenase-like lactoylglutathione lyase family enzyme